MKKEVALPPDINYQVDALQGGGTIIQDGFQ
jgi:hypothetical protein